MDNNNIPERPFSNHKSLPKNWCKKFKSGCHGNSSACHWFLTWIPVKVSSELFLRAWGLTQPPCASPPESRHNLHNFPLKDLLITLR